MQSGSAVFSLLFPVTGPVVGVKPAGQVTYLTRHSGLADAELQLITGHSRRETLAIYQHVALDGELEDKYQAAMKEAGL